MIKTRYRTTYFLLYFYDNEHITKQKNMAYAKYSKSKFKLVAKLNYKTFNRN